VAFHVPTVTSPELDTLNCTVFDIVVCFISPIVETPPAPAPNPPTFTLVQETDKKETACPLAIFAAVTAPSASFSVVTLPSIGVRESDRRASLPWQTVPDVLP
jgi:hypothetical protein